MVVQYLSSFHKVLDGAEKPGHWPRSALSPWSKACVIASGIFPQCSSTTSRSLRHPRVLFEKDAATTGSAAPSRGSSLGERLPRTSAVYVGRSAP